MIRTYIGILNVIAFILFGVDKYKAKRNRWRISESTLLLSAVFGGGLGALAGMYCFRHKTRKIKFTVGIPCILIVQAILIIMLNK